MAIKLADVIFVLSIEELAKGIITLYINNSAGRYYLCIITKPYAGSRANKCYFSSINKSVGKYYFCTTIKSH